MMKRFALLLLVAIICAQMMASTSFTIGHLVYSSSDGKTVSVKSDNNEIHGELVIPASVENESVTYSVTSIEFMAFRRCSGLTSVVIPKGVTSIGVSAFWGCSGLTSVVIPESVTSIGAGAFWGCSGLTSVVIPKGVTIIDAAVFSRCSGLTSVVIPKGVTSIVNGAFDGCSGLTSVDIPESVTSIGDCAFQDCSGLTSMIIPRGVTSIGERAFSGCSGLTSVVVDANNPTYDSHNKCNAIIETATNKLITGCKNTTIPVDITSIASYAFAGCSGLTSVTIPEGVTSIGEWAFFDCSGLTSVVIPAGVTSIGERAFYDCSGLTSVVIPEGVTSIGDCAFLDCSGFTSVVVDANNTTYDSRNNCNAIIETATNKLITGCKNTTIPTDITSIGDWAFSSCSGLTSTAIPEGVTSIGKSAYSGCSGLTSMVIPEGVTSIGEYAFSRCSGLTSMVIPEGVTSIGNEAFYGCSGLSTLRIKASVLNNYSFLKSCGTGCTVYVKMLWDGMNRCECKIVPEFNPQISASPTGCTVQAESIPVAVNCHISDVAFTLSPAAPSFFMGGLRPSTTAYLTYSFTTEDGRTGTYTGKDYPLTLPALELTTLNSTMTSANCAVVAANTNISDRETRVGFQWRKTDAPHDMPSKEAFVAIHDGHLKMSINNIQSGSYYRVRPFYKATDGSYYYGEWIAFDPSDLYK